MTIHTLLLEFPIPAHSNRKFIIAVKLEFTSLLTVTSLCCVLFRSSGHSRLGSRNTQAFWPLWQWIFESTRNISWRNGQHARFQWAKGFVSDHQSLYTQVSVHGHFGIRVGWWGHRIVNTRGTTAALVVLDHRLKFHALCSTCRNVGTLNYTGLRKCVACGRSVPQQSHQSCEELRSTFTFQAQVQEKKFLCVVVFSLFLVYCLYFEAKFLIPD